MYHVRCQYTNHIHPFTQLASSTTGPSRGWHLHLSSESETALSEILLYYLYRRCFGHAMLRCLAEDTVRRWLCRHALYTALRAWLLNLSATSGASSGLCQPICFAVSLIELRCLFKSMSRDKVDAAQSILRDSKSIRHAAELSLSQVSGGRKA